MKDLQASIHFLAQSELYHTEKPYALRYTGEKEIAQTNIQLEKHDDIPIHDIRGRERDFSLEKNGFTISKMSSRMFYRDFSDPERVNAIYLHEVATHLKDMLGARHVQIYEHMVNSFPPSALVSLKTHGRFAKDIQTSPYRRAKSTSTINRHPRHILVGC